MKILFVIALAFFGNGAPAFAHLGHLGEVASHNHWVAGIAIGIAIVAGVKVILGDTSDTEDTSEDEGSGDPDMQEEALA